MTAKLDIAAGRTVSQAIRAAAAALAGSSDTARLDAELLMAEALGVSRSDMLLHHGNDAAPPAFDPLVQRRADHEPVAYILGHQEFYGRSFIVTSDVLIPRGDSECVVDAALEFLADHSRILDCGTGSGALLLTLLAEKPGCEGIGIDRSLGALAVAAANAARLGVQDRAHLLSLDWTEDGWSAGLGEFNLIIANPPYVETEADIAPSVRGFEPGSALFAGADGLDDYRILMPLLAGLLAEKGTIILEIGFEQAESVSRLATGAGFTANLRRDLANRPRALVLRQA